MQSCAPHNHKAESSTQGSAALAATTRPASVPARKRLLCLRRKCASLADSVCGAGAHIHHHAIEQASRAGDGQPTAEAEQQQSSKRGGQPDTAVTCRCFWAAGRACAHEEPAALCFFGRTKVRRMRRTKNNVEK